ncbi:transcriptional regulator GcvA [Mesorhizobium sp. CN2-181]|uniref:transcriptional regulator GcvA n=1 Tax=Mesorhizobium yinganensis TaxID=3157707 RepID=UPI0032B829A6
MKRGRLPLTALRSFEAAGRHLSFSRAAEELFVSQAAISRQIRELESLLEKPLFERLHRKVALTETGTHLLAQLTASFDAIDNRLDEIIRRPAQHVVTVSVEPSFAAAWLVPRLHLFNSLRPDVDVSIDASARLADFRGHAVDLAIRHSLTVRSWPRTQSRHLTNCGKMPVMAPGLLASGPPVLSPSDLCRHTLIHEDNRDGWSDWFKEAGVKDIEPQRGPIYPDAALAAQSAALGHGVALGCWLLCGPDLEAGRLVAPFPREFPYGAYWIVAPDFAKLGAPAAAFAGWLLAEVAEERAVAEAT